MKFFNQHGDLIKTIGLAIVVFGAAIWFTSRFIEPAPPSTITLSSGSETGAYHLFAKQYQAILQRNDITLKILPSSGSPQNIERLQNKEADIAFVQGGTNSPVIDSDESILESLGSLYYEPIWVFLAAGFDPHTLADFSGKRIAVGSTGSGTQIVSKQLLALNDVDANNAKLLEMSSLEAATALKNNKLDAGFFVSSIDSPLIQELLRNDKIHLFDMQRAESYHRLLAYLSKIELPMGVIDLANNIPAESKTLLAPSSYLVIRDDLHPALRVLVLQAMQEIHQQASVFAEQGHFPATNDQPYPLSEDATRFYKSGPPFLMRYLPFSFAVLIDRLIVFILPLLALLFPLFKVMPPLYRWRVRSRIYRWYEELQQVDTTINDDESLNSDLSLELNNTLDRIVREVDKEKTPLSYADQLYQLLAHTEQVRQRLHAKCKRLNIEVPT